MGLQGQLNDVSSDSIPLLLVAIVASCVAYLRSAVIGLAHIFDPPGPTQSGFSGPGLAGLIVLADQLTLNRQLSYAHQNDSGEEQDCVVCMSTLSTGDRVRRLSCRHVFHKGCLDACIGHLSFNCPLCRAPFAASSAASAACVPSTRESQRVGHELVALLSSTR